jgi:trk system potassium uptake protein TrkH
MLRQVQALHYAVRWRVLAKYLGQLCLVVSLLTLGPLVAALGLDDPGLSWRCGGVLIGLAGAGMVLTRVRVPADIQVNEGIVVAAGIFLLTPVVMTYPFMAAGLSFADAMFETVSGITTTGLSTLTTVGSVSKSFLVTRAWLQWYGGLGIVVLSLAFVVEPGLTAKRLAVTEADADDLAGGTRAHARRVLRVYGLLTGVGMLALLAAGATPFDALAYTLAAVSTGGFAPHDASLAGLGAWHLQAVVMALCGLGALPFALWSGLINKQRRLALPLLQLRALVVSGLVATIVLGSWWWLTRAMPLSQIIRQAPLLAWSAQSTAGFTPMALSKLDAASKLVLILAMAVGGGVGSTAGGFKVLRLLIALRVLHVTIVRTCSPRHAVLVPRMAGQRLPESEMREALLLIVLFGGVIVTSWLPFVLMDYDPLDALFEVVSATGTVGLSVGLTSQHLPALLKGVLCADMLLGRLEIFAWLVVIYPPTWIGRRRIDV